jgi:hypothetical protein
VASIDDILDDEVVPAKKKTEAKKPAKVEEINIDDIDLDMYGEL